jgi:hypothetical protein
MKEEIGSQSDSEAKGAIYDSTLSLVNGVEGDFVARLLARLSTSESFKVKDRDENMEAVVGGSNSTQLQNV